jgi:hypothetical protein
MQHPLEVKARTHIEISDSQVKLFQACPRSWAYQRLLKIKPEEDRWNLYYGSAVHKGLEHLHKGDLLKGAVEAAVAVVQKDAPSDAEMAAKAAAVVEGYARLFYPLYQTNWVTLACEEWYEYFSDPVVKIRGSRDNKSAAKQNMAHRATLDFKTTAFKDGGDLGKNLRFNHQLALYCISEYRVSQQWPQEMGLVFLQKPRTDDLAEWCRRAKTDAGLYTMKTEPVTPEFAWYALSVEEEMTLTGRKMFEIARAFDINGVSALNEVLPNYNGCFEYGRKCGFAQGCHSCKPIHRVMQGIQPC